ncbi:MAG: FAD-dependent oxidoreductase [Christensenellales bacterium]|jgi:urocanate reductase
MKKLLCLFLALALVFGCAACATTDSEVNGDPVPAIEPTPVPEAGIYTPGSYTGKARGFGGEVTVEVTVDANAITNVLVIGDSETAGVGTLAIEQMPDAILAAQSAQVDSVTGATITSAAIIEALEKALAAARGEAQEVGAISFTPGTYTGTGAGYNGNVVLSVTFSQDAITGIEIVEQRETEHVGDCAYDIMFQAIMDHTSTGVDVVSGATFTSNAILTAVEDAANQAGCSVDALRVGAIPYTLTPKAKITDTYDVVVVGAGGAGMAAGAAAAQQGATVLVIEKNVEMGGNTLVSGGSFQAVQPSLVWDPENPEATTGIFEPTGEEVNKVKSDVGRLATLRTILDWSEQPFDGSNTAHIKNVDDYDLPSRGVHPEYLDTLLTLKEQIREYLKYADKHLSRGESETDLTVFSTIELHIFQTYYGGLRLSHDKSEWIYSDFELVKQMCEKAYDIKPWLIEQGAQFNNQITGTLIGCLWQRTNSVRGGIVDGEEYKSKWGGYFKVPENTILKANPKNKIMTRTTADALITDSSGRVVGVHATQYDGTEVEITATKGVILATGGYAANIQMVIDTNKYWSSDDLLPTIKTTNRNFAMGDGIVMAQAVGAAVTGMGYTQLMPLGWVDNGNLAGGTGENVIYISPAGHPNAGKRFVDESAERDVLSQGAFDYGTDGGVYVELGNAGQGTAENNIEGRVYYCTLEEAEELLGIDAAVLEQTIREYDAYIIGATDVSPVPSKNAYRGTIGNCDRDEDGHYIIESYHIDKIKVRFMAPSTHHTMGGLVVDLDRHVLDSSGKPIPGLYAAGEVTGGFFAGNRLGANAVTEILVSGRIAGESAAAGK